MASVLLRGRDFPADDVFGVSQPGGPRTFCGRLLGAVGTGSLRRRALDQCGAGGKMERDVLPGLEPPAQIAPPGRERVDPSRYVNPVLPDLLDLEHRTPPVVPQRIHLDLARSTGASRLLDVQEAPDRVVPVGKAIDLYD
ncbi:MAG TPA: hypothetical protein VMS86_14215, partial [Thermoanaerobaculia bacterium]|nr:hypothetical protein [Thermoanaerobaculia bacterium]